MNDDDNFPINIMHHFYNQISMKMYLRENNMNHQKFHENIILDNNK